MRTQSLNHVSTLTRAPTRPPTPECLSAQHTVNTWLHSVGYETMLCGKYMNGYHGSRGRWATYIPPGWTDWMGFQVSVLQSGPDSVFGCVVGVDV